MKYVLKIITLNQINLIEIFLYLGSRKMFFFSSYIWDQIKYILLLIWNIRKKNDIDIYSHLIKSISIKKIFFPNLFLIKTWY